MKRIAFAAAFVACALILPGAPAAQPASAMGKALPDASLPTGTVTVRVIRGSMARPAIGIDVALIAGKDNRYIARTNSEGRATFAELEPGTTFVAEAVDGEKTVRSEPFEVPERSGARLLLSTEEIVSGGPMASGRPDPRMMSGMARPQRGDPAGRLTVRAIQGQISPTESHAPVGALVHLIGIAASGEVTSQTQTMDKEGRVIFDDLATDGSVAYYVQSLFARGEKRDRLVSQPLSLPPMVGVRLMLAGHAADSPEPAIDDLSRLGKLRGKPEVGPGRAVVRVGGEIANVEEIELFEVSNPERVVKRPATQAIPMPSEVHCSMAPSTQTDAALPGDKVVVEVRQARTGSVLGSAKVDILDANNLVVASATRDPKTGFFTATVKADAAAKLRARVTLLVSTFGELRPVTTFSTQLFSLDAKAGTRVRGTCQFQMGNRVEGRFSGLPSGPDKVYIARVREGGRLHYSAPFQLTPERGAAVDIIVYSWPAFAFHFGGELDDETFWFQGQLVLINLGASPVTGKSGEVPIPLPKGFVGAKVMEPYEKRVRIDGDEGLFWRGAIPPGQTALRAVFGLPVDEGAVQFDLDLPYGAMDSQLSVATLPGLELDLPPGTQKRIKTLENGLSFWVISGINVRPEKRIVMGISGLPEGAAWKTYAGAGGAAAVIAFLAWAIFGLARGAGRAQAAFAALEGKRQRLLDEIAALDKGRDKDETDAERKKTDKRRAKLVRDLEAVYAELENTKSG